MPARAKFPPRFKMAGMPSFLFTFVSELVDDYALMHNILEDNDDDMVVLAAVGCFMRRKLTRVGNYFEATIPKHLPDEFENHFA